MRYKDWIGYGLVAVVSLFSGVAVCYALTSTPSTGMKEAHRLQDGAAVDVHVNPASKQNGVLTVDRLVSRGRAETSRSVDKTSDTSVELGTQPGSITDVLGGGTHSPAPTTVIDTLRSDTPAKSNAPTGSTRRAQESANTRGGTTVVPSTSGGAGGGGSGLSLGGSGASGGGASSGGGAEGANGSAPGSIAPAEDETLAATEPETDVEANVDAAVDVDADVEDVSSEEQVAETDDEDHADPVGVSLSGFAQPRGDRILAFPGAKGYGAYVSGGRGGDVYSVTSLEDSGPGSLRYGIENADGPRTIVFQTGGTIYLKSKLRIGKDDLTIAGQTAPGDGITIAGQPVSLTSTNVIIRHLRIRVGDINAVDRPASAEHGVAFKAGNGLKNVIGAGADGLSISGASQAIVDHISLSWAMDETLSVTTSSNITVQNCLIAESLDDSYHEKGPHGYGSLVVGGPDIQRGSGLTMVQNLYMHHRHRSPGISTYFRKRESGGRLRLDFSNNVVYNWKRRASNLIWNDENGRLEFNLSGNVYLAGQDSERLSTVTFNNLKDNSFYARNNYLTERGGEPRKLFSQHPLDVIKPAIKAPPFKHASNYPPAHLENWVTQHVGAFLGRDTVDERLIDDFQNRQGGIIDSQDEVGGFPTLSPGEPKVDSDLDGMPDTWELEHQLNPNDPADRNQRQANGRTMLELYLNSLIQYEENLDDALLGYD